MNKTTKGPLSQAIDSLNSSINQLNGIQELPSEAQGIKGEVIQSLNEIIPTIENIKNLTQNFTNHAHPMLVEAETKGGERAKLLVQQVQKQTSSVSTELSSMEQEVKANFTKIIGHSASLNSIQSNLNNEIIKLKTQMITARSEVEAEKKKKKYYLLLGPLGLAGLAIAISLIKKSENKVKEIEFQLKQMSNQISRLSMMKNAVQETNDIIMTLTSKIQSIRNELDFLSSDIAEVTQDLDHTESNPIWKAYILAAIKEVETLKTDAS